MGRQAVRITLNDDVSRGTHCEEQSTGFAPKKCAAIPVAQPQATRRDERAARRRVCVVHREERAEHRWERAVNREEEALHRAERATHANLRAAHHAVRSARRCLRVGKRYALRNAPLASCRASFRTGLASLEGARAWLGVRRNAVRRPRRRGDRRRNVLRAPSASLAPPLARRRLRDDARRNRSDARRAHERCSTKGEGSPASSSDVAPRRGSDDTHASRCIL
jgi:hypothetical protein